VSNYAKSNFTEIAKYTDGQCAFLDINSPAGTEELTKLVTQEVLRDVGGASKGEQLVAAYKKAYR